MLKRYLILKRHLLSKILLAGCIVFSHLNISIAEETVQNTPSNDPSDEFLYTLKESLVKVSSTTKNGGIGYGTGVAISPNHVVTNCHVIANSSGVSISVWGDSFGPVALQADWKHDLCILRFEWAKLRHVTMGDSDSLKYEQPVISISMPGDSPAPYVALSKIKALYTMDDSKVIRSSAAFAIGASGSPVFDYNGKLIGISTFKSPGRVAYFYNMPVKWVKAALLLPEIKLDAPRETPFWDAPDEGRPFFMRIALPFQNNRWEDVKKISALWVAKEPNSVEAHFYSGIAEENLGNIVEAKKQFQHALSIQPLHPATMFELGLMANREGNQIEVDKTHVALKTIDIDLDDDFTQALKPAAVQ